MDIKPIIKWAGGKRQIINDLIKNLPKKYDNYFEPFIGAGALYFQLEPKNACINDMNHSLINLYTICRDHNKELKIELSKLQDKFNFSDSKDQIYYEIRQRYNEILNTSTIEEASLFVFLNKTNFNGLYRVNSKGKYNVPFGQKKKVDLSLDKFENISSLLLRTTILEGDFEDACIHAKKGDFIYFDPPYHETFVDYQSNGFSVNEQIRLYNLFVKLTEQGVYCMLSNSDSAFILELYKKFNIKILKTKRYINRVGSNRIANEIIVTNYEVQSE